MKLPVILVLVASVFSLQTYCPDGQFFDGQHCEYCQANCKCTAKGGCDSCIVGYTFSTDLTTCVSCPTASGNYAACTQCCTNDAGTSLSCTDCDTSLYQGSTFLMSGRCLIKTGCFQIDTRGFCLSCRNGYYFRDNGCVQCDSSCLTCNGADNCQECADGYYNLNNNGALCTACPTGCASCDVSANCQKCLTGYYLFNTQCLACPTDCATCTDGSTCSSCTAGILVSNLCIRCTDLTYGGSVGCIGCIASSSFVNCTSCADTYYLDSSGNCQPCSNAIPNAVRCLDSLTPTQCQDDNVATLTSRYYLLSVSCVANVKSCRRVTSIAGDCLSCYDGYTINGTMFCQPCPFTGCVLANRTVVANVCTCTLCEVGYNLNVGICTACTVPSCAACPSSVSTCTACLPGFYLSGPSCLAATVLNCQTATDAVTCSLCIDGYYLGSDGSCYQCQSNCLKCSSKYVCTACQPGHYLVGQGNCFTYLNNCQVMDTTKGICKVCSHGFVLYKGFCKDCSVERGTLQLCSGLCPLDYYIENILIAIGSPMLHLTMLTLLVVMAL